MPQNMRLQSAHNDFKEARKQAAIEQVLAGLKGESIDLLSFEEVRRDLKAGEVSVLGLQEIPVDAIVGSVDRTDDYTRTFKPKLDSDAERWSRLKSHIEYRGMEPISVFKLGEAYFVSDGHHRVSITRQIGYKTIQAYVTDVDLRVPLSPDDSLDEIICRARFAEFLDKTDLDKNRPDADLSTTICGQYRLLQEQIEVVQHLLMLDPTRDEVTFPDAAGRWYDTVYMPQIQLIRKQGLQHHFPDRTETDLYVLVARHRAELYAALNWRVDAVAAVSDLARQKKWPAGVLGGRLYDVLVPDAFEAGPAPGRWRRERLDKRPSANLFPDIMVACQAIPGDQTMFEHAAILARREHGRLFGLHVVQRKELQDSESVESQRQVFSERCREYGVRGEFAVEVGPVRRKIVERAAWADLLVLALSREPETGTATGFGTHFNQILQRSPRPILVVPEQADSTMDRVLLAYDGSAKANEALFAAAYFAEEWSATLFVLSVGKKQAKSALKSARGYLEERKIEAGYIQTKGSAARAIIESCRLHDCNLVVMGGFGHRPLFQLFLGSQVNKVLEMSDRPILICR